MFDERLWRLLCAERGHGGHPTLDDIGELVDAGLLRRRDDTMAFDDGALWDFLRDRSHREGRAEAIRGAAAAAYGRQGTPEASIVAARILVDLGRERDALQLLARTDRAFHRADAVRRRAELSALAETIFELLALRHGLSRQEQIQRLQFELGSILAEQQIGAFDAAIERGGRVAREASAHAASDVAVEALTLVAMGWLSKGELDKAHDVLVEAESARAQVVDPRVIALTYRRCRRTTCSEFAPDLSPRFVPVR